MRVIGFGLLLRELFLRSVLLSMNDSCVGVWPE